MCLPDELTRKRVSILHRYFSYVCDRTHPCQAEDLVALRTRFAMNAGVQKIPDQHKWLLKITMAFENMTATGNSQDREDRYHAGNAIYHDNRRAFDRQRPEDCMLSLQKMN